jgi:hypothetical protein
MVLSDVPVEFNFHGAGSYWSAAQKQAFFIRRNSFAADAGSD